MPTLAIDRLNSDFANLFGWHFPKSFRYPLVLFYTFYCRFSKSKLFYMFQVPEALFAYSGQYNGLYTRE